MYFVTVVIIQMGHLLSVRTKVPYFASLCGPPRGGPAAAAATAVAREEAHEDGSDTAEEAKDARTATASPGTAVVGPVPPAAAAAVAAAASRPAGGGGTCGAVHRKVRWTVVCAWVGSVVVALVFTEVEFLHRTCGTGSVPAVYWGYAFGWSALFFAFGEVRKWMFYCYPNSALAKLLAW